MQNIITYWFGPGGHEEKYEYEWDFNEASDYIEQTHTSEDILEDFILSGLYEKESEKSKEGLLGNFGFTGNVEDIKNMNEDSKDLLAEELVFDLLSYSDIYEDELKDYFEQAAYDQWGEGY